MPVPVSTVVPVDPEKPELGVEVDPWADAQFAQPYVASNSLAEEIADIASEPEFQPEPAPAAPAPSSVNEPPAEPDDQPEIVELQDGSSITIEKTNKGWKASLDSGTGAGKEVFYGKTKNELLINVASGKINSTKKIRTQEKELKKFKLQSIPSEPITPTETRPTAITADDIFKLKTQMESNPAEAVEEVIRKRTGMGLDELANLAREGRDAKRTLTSEEVAREFMSSNPDYYADPRYENYQAILSYMVRNKLHKVLPENPEQVKAVASELFTKGFWTVSSLQEAFDYLKSEGLLIIAADDSEEETPVQEPVVAAPVAAAPAQPPANSRIVRTGPRAGLGIRSSGASAPPPQPASTKPPSVEELENMTDEEIARLMAATRQYAINTRRR